MPLLSLTWTSVVLLSVLIYVACTFYKKDCRKYHPYFAICTFIICTVAALVIEVALRRHGIKMYDGERIATTYETIAFYTEQCIIYGGAYALVLWMKNKTARRFLQVALVMMLCFSFAKSYSMAVNGYNMYADHPSCRPCPPPSHAQFTQLCGASLNFSGTPSAVMYFWPSVFEKFTPSLQCSAR